MYSRPCLYVRRTETKYFLVINRKKRNLTSFIFVTHIYAT